MPRIAADIFISSGVFDDQPEVFSHLLDTDPAVNFDAIDVIQGTMMRKRLGGYFPPQFITEILTLMGADDTLVLFLPDCEPVETVRLRALGLFTGTIIRADGPRS
jgi:hypothetical protein